MENQVLYASAAKFSNEIKICGEKNVSFLKGQSPETVVV